MKTAKPIRKLSASQFKKLAAEFTSTKSKKRAAELEKVLLPYAANAPLISVTDEFMTKIGFIKTPDAIIDGKLYHGVYELSPVASRKLAALENRKWSPLPKPKSLSAKAEKMRRRMYDEVERLFGTDKYAAACQKLAAFEQKIQNGEIE
jgi:hypothetical protein